LLRYGDLPASASYPFLNSLICLYEPQPGVQAGLCKLQGRQTWRLPPCLDIVSVVSYLLGGKLEEQEDIQREGG
jgi:hypothetical protein